MATHEGKRAKYVTITASDYDRCQAYRRQASAELGRRLTLSAALTEILDAGINALARNVDPDRLPDLTDTETAFVQALALGKRTLEAYQMAQFLEDSDKAPDDASPPVVPPVTTQAREATKLFHRPHIQAWITAMKTAALDGRSHGIDDHMAQLARVHEIAEQRGLMPSALRSLELMGRASRLYGSDTDQSSPPDVAQLMASLASRLQADTLTLLARDLGVPAPLQVDGYADNAGVGDVKQLSP